MTSPGFELLFNSVRSQLRSPQDSLICAFHWELVANGLKCIGVGEQADQDDRAEDSEMLPAGWNANRDCYALRYRHTENKRLIYVFKVICINEDLMLHLMNTKEGKISTVNIRTSDYATGDNSSFKKAFQNLRELTKLFQTEIIDALLKESKSNKYRETEPSRSSQQEQRSRLQEEDPLRVPSRHTQRPPPPEWADPGDPYSIGRGDLDPFAGGRGGGMLFDPLRTGGPRFAPDPNAGLPQNLPRGSIPPGARFDPFGPPGQRSGPDPDHLPPPGYDDMFM